MLWNPSEVLEWSFSSLMVVGIKFFPSPFVIWMPEIPIRRLRAVKTGRANISRGSGWGSSPVIVRPVAPVVPVIVVLVRPLSGGDVVAVTTWAAVHVSVWAAIIVVLVAMLFVLMVSVSLPGLVAVAWIRVFTVPRPVPPLCNETGSNFPMKSNAYCDPACSLCPTYHHCQNGVYWLRYKALCGARGGRAGRSVMQIWRITEYQWSLGWSRTALVWRLWPSLQDPPSSSAPSRNMKDGLKGKGLQLTVTYALPKLASSSWDRFFCAIL